MEPQVVVKTAQLLELFGTKFARQDFVHSLRDAVASVCDRVVFVLAHLEPVRPLLLLVVAAVEGLHDLHFAREEFVIVFIYLGAVHLAVFEQHRNVIFLFKFIGVRAVQLLKFDDVSLCVGRWII